MAVRKFHEAEEVFSVIGTMSKMEERVKGILSADPHVLDILRYVASKEDMFSELSLAKDDWRYSGLSEGMGNIPTKRAWPELFAKCSNVSKYSVKVRKKIAKSILETSANKEADMLFSILNGKFSMPKITPALLKAVDKHVQGNHSK